MVNESDVRIVDIPGYMVWSRKKIQSGGSPEIIANLDSNCMWLSPDDIDAVKEEDFEEMYQEIAKEIGGE